MRRLIILGNCVATRLAFLLEKLLDSVSFSKNSSLPQWQVVKCAPVYNLTGPSAFEALAKTVSSCDLVFTQPLFNFGALNTSNLKERAGSRVHTFSAPNFEAYFPDVMDIRPYKEPERFPAPLEWHSSIIVACKAAGIPVHEVEEIYLHHPIFKKQTVAAKIAESFSHYEKREQGVEIGSLEFVRNNFSKTPLFHTFNHPADPLLKHLLCGILKALPLPDYRGDIITRLPWHDDPETGAWSEWGFGFNSWPIITRQHRIFDFKGREFFRVAGTEIDITTCAIAYYNYYDAHPLIFKQALAAARAKGLHNGTKN